MFIPDNVYRYSIPILFVYYYDTNNRFSMLTFQGNVSHLVIEFLERFTVVQGR